jgi:hypothetical protein
LRLIAAVRETGIPPKVKRLKYSSN